MLDRPDFYGEIYSPKIVARGRTLKLRVVDACCEAASKAMNLLSHYGIDREYDIEKHWRDVKIIQLWMGADSSARWMLQGIFMIVKCYELDKSLIYPRWFYG